MPGKSTTTVDSGMYLFFPKELEAVTTGFYGSLWENIRVKVKEVRQGRTCWLVCLLSAFHMRRACLQAA